MSPGGSKPYRRAYVGGTFDLFHRGHENLIWRAKQIADEVVVALNTDAFTARYKRWPAEVLEARWEKVAGCRYVDFVVINAGGEDSKPALEVVAPDVICHGDDWTGPEYLAQLGVTTDWLDERGIELVYFPYTPGISTTDLLKERTHARQDRR